MKARIETVAWISSLLFGIVTLWSVTVRGIFEPARLDVAHFDAGAGSPLLLLRGGLACIATLLLGALVFFRRPLQSRLLSAVSALLIVPVFIWSCIGLERWAPGYVESTFTSLLSRYSDGQPITGRQVFAAIGRPVFTGLLPTGETVWSYSYMPSSGFGWHKRIFWLHDDQIVRVYSLDEP